MEPEDGDRAPVEFLDHRLSVDVYLAGDQLGLRRTCRETSNRAIGIIQREMRRASRRSDALRFMDCNVIAWSSALASLESPQA